MAEEQQQNEAPTGGVHLRNAFHQSVDEGRARLRRGWLDLVATGTVGGMDVSLGVLALLLIEEATGSAMLGALGFTIGFLALALGRSELFTENFLVPIAALAAEKGTVAQLLRLWGGTLVTNLIGGLLFAVLIVVGFPRLHQTANALAARYVEAGRWEAVALGLLAGMTITFMTWSQQGARSDIGRLVAVVMAAFVLAAGHLHHVIVLSVGMFVALLTGDAVFGIDEWAGVAGLAVVTNMVGGLVLVTIFRLAQVGRREIEAERLRPESDEEEQRKNVVEPADGP